MIGPQTLLQNRYLVIKQIGQGGMGAVYIATDQRFGSTVALKETFFADTALRKAFEREAHLLNRLRHPALPRVSDHFIEDDGQFLVMEFIPGDDLSEMLKTQGGAFPVKEVLDWADQLLDALDYLHTQESSVIHRDIKPQNLKLTPRGQIVLLDFGLAKGTPLQVSQATASGSVFGYSRNYAPIEQIQGTGTDLRSDLYSLAATLYHLMTGAPPPDALTRATSVLNGEEDPLVPPHKVHGQITPAVSNALMRAMSQNARQRPQTASEMRDELREASKQTLVTGNVTNAQRFAASTLLEQDTQIIGTHAADPQAPTNVSIEEVESVAHVPAETQVVSTGTTSAGEVPPATSLGTQQNETTQVALTSESPSKFSKQQLGVAASILLVIIIGAVMFAVTRRSNAPSTESPAIPQAASPSPTVQENQQPTPATSPADELPGDSNNTAEQKSEPASKTKSTSKNSAVIPKPPKPPADDEDPDPDVVGDTRTRDGEPDYDQIREQRRLAARERRRAQAERQKAERARRQAQERARQATQP